MADHTRYVDVAVSGGLGDGTSWENAWSSLYNNWDEAMSLGGSVDVYCRGGADPWPEAKYFSGVTSYLRVIGDWDGFDFSDTGFTIQGTSTTDLALLILNPTAFEIEPRVDVSAVLRLEKLKMETSPLCVAPHASRIIRTQWNNAGLELDGVGITLNSASPDTAGLYVINQVASTANTLSIYNSTFRYGQYPTPSTASRLLFRSASGPATTEIANSTFYANPQVLADDSPIVGGPNNGPEMTVRNCIIAGHITGGLIDNCVYHEASNAGPREDSQQVPIADQRQWWVDSEGGDFSPVDLESGPIELVDTGDDASAYVGSSLDVKGNDRNAPAAGAAWDIGPYEWGFAASTPHPGIHEVQDLTHANDPNNIYFGQSVQEGDQFSFKETTEANGWAVSIDALGYPIIDPAGGSGTDSFLFNIDKGDDWEPEPPDSYTWKFSISAITTQETPEGLLQSLQGEGWNVSLSTGRFSVTDITYSFNWEEAVQDAYIEEPPNPLRADINQYFNR